MLRIRERLDRIERRHAAREQEAHLCRVSMEMERKDAAPEDLYRSSYIMTAFISVVFALVLALGSACVSAWRWVQGPLNRAKAVDAAWALCTLTRRVATDPAYRRQIAAVFIDAICAGANCVITSLSDLAEEAILYFAAVLLLPFFFLSGGWPCRLG